jgi:hypothetical protein
LSRLTGGQASFFGRFVLFLDPPPLGAPLWVFYRSDNPENSVAAR